LSNWHDACFASSSGKARGTFNRPYPSRIGSTPLAKEQTMLVLTRKQAEQIQIGENVVITILRVKGQSVRIGIEAPREVRVMRAELPKIVDQTDESQSISVAARSSKESPAACPASQSDSKKARRSSAGGFHGAAQAANLKASPLARMVSRRASAPGQAAAFQAYA
jgi:carbon storage regulator